MIIKVFDDEIVCSLKDQQNRIGILACNEKHDDARIRNNSLLLHEIPVTYGTRENFRIRYFSFLTKNFAVGRDLDFLAELAKFLKGNTVTIAQFCRLPPREATFIHYYASVASAKASFANMKIIMDTVLDQYPQMMFQSASLDPNSHEKFSSLTMAVRSNNSLMTEYLLDRFFKKFHDLPVDTKKICFASLYSGVTDVIASGSASLSVMAILKKYLVHLYVDRHNDTTDDDTPDIDAINNSIIIQDRVFFKEYLKALLQAKKGSMPTLLHYQLKLIEDSHAASDTKNIVIENKALLKKLSTWLEHQTKIMIRNEEKFSSTFSNRGRIFRKKMVNSFIDDTQEISIGRHKINAANTFRLIDIIFFGVWIYLTHDLEMRSRDNHRFKSSYIASLTLLIIASIAAAIVLMFRVVAQAHYDKIIFFEIGGYSKYTINLPSMIAWSAGGCINDYQSPTIFDQKQQLVTILTELRDILLEFHTYGAANVTVKKMTEKLANNGVNLSQADAIAMILQLQDVCSKNYAQYIEIFPEPINMSDSMKNIIAILPDSSDVDIEAQSDCATVRLCCDSVYKQFHRPNRNILATSDSNISMQPLISASAVGMGAITNNHSSHSK